MVLQQFPGIDDQTVYDFTMVGIGYFPVTYITPPIVMGKKDIVTSVDETPSNHL